MKKSNFILRSAGNGSDVIISFNGKPLKKISNYKKALRFIALYATQKNIDNFELLVWERGKFEKITDFDPEVILNHSDGKINGRKQNDIDFLDDDGEDREGSMREFMERRYGRGDKENKDFESFMRRFRGRNERGDEDDFDFDNMENNDFDDDSFRGMGSGPSQPRRPSWSYRPADTSRDVETIKKNLKSIFNRF